MALLSIVIPAYNEAERLGDTLRGIRAYASSSPYEVELLICDDGSKDRTLEVAQHESKGLNCRVLRADRNRGKGHAVRGGMMAAKGEFVLFTDADLSTPIEEVDKLLAAIEQGADMAFGSRALSESQVQIRQNPLREAMGKVFNLMARLLTFRGIRDSQCGFKCFRRNHARALFGQSRINGFCFDAEITYLAQRAGYRIAEVPVIWRNDARSKVNIVGSPLGMFLDLFRIRWLHRKGN